jgi:lactoylglutathione lyase
MKLLRKEDFPGGKFTLAFVGYGDEKDHTVVELTHNWRVSRWCAKPDRWRMAAR